MMGGNVPVVEKSMGIGQVGVGVVKLGLSMVKHERLCSLATGGCLMAHKRYLEADGTMMIKRDKLIWNQAYTLIR